MPATVNANLHGVITSNRLRNRLTQRRGSVRELNGPQPFARVSNQVALVLGGIEVSDILDGPPEVVVNVVDRQHTARVDLHVNTRIAAVL